MGEKKNLYQHLPSCPGVYLMKNKEGVIIYVGKSNNLKARVKSYFVVNASLNFAKKKMVKIIEKIDYIETKTDLEALMLETNLIKKNQPKYNVLMKDGKNLSYIKITDGEIPCLIRTRIKTKHGQYFGPYSQYFDTYNYVRFIRRLFKLGNHEKIDKFGPPCMDTYIDICPGHCTGDKDKIKEYCRRLAEARDFLMGNQENVLSELEKKMKLAAGERRYEEALELKNTIQQIESAGSKQIVRDVISGDATVMVTLEKYNHIFISFIEVKNSMIVGVHEYKLANPLEETNEELVSQAVLQYLSTETIKTLYTDIETRTMGELQEYLLSQKIKLKQPSRGEKVRILEFAHTNLLNFAYQEEMSGLKNATLSKKTMVDLMEKIGFETKELAKKKEIIFECFDISHSHGEHTVASKSVLVNGKPEPKRYKKYRIKTLNTGVIDDFASMDEILTRRSLGALRGEDNWPDLIIIDGGKGQLSHAVAAIKKATNTENIIPIISLAKRIEEVFLPENAEPILLEKGSGELMILQKIRDEAHRFAINYNRSSREKSYTKTLLDEIPGIGPVARKKIFSAISRLEELSTWSHKQAKEAFGEKVAETLQNHGLIGE
ncbi:excinuclease ABC subunit UvrC [Candidatus Gracilibacteria bacterium]|nr:excinuclease ABC subunit UvrC [Candidatus Gracilibacteria bacterium]